jgi:hypothetical protein
MSMARLWRDQGKRCASAKFRLVSMSDANRDRLIVHTDMDFGKACNPQPHIRARIGEQPD